MVATEEIDITKVDCLKRRRRNGHMVILVIFYLDGDCYVGTCNVRKSPSSVDNPVVPFYYAIHWNDI